MKKDHMLFPILFIIYIIAGIVSIILFYSSGSNLSRKLQDAEAVMSEADAPDTDVIPEPEITEEPEDTVSEPDIAEEPVEEVSEPEQPVDAVSEPDMAEEPVEEVSEPEEPEDTSEESEEPDTEASDDAVASEEEVEDDTEEDDGKTYYAFEVNSGVSAVRVRRTSDRNSEIVGRVNGGDTGYILEMGDTRSKIVTADGSVIGYVYNEYITISEISKKDYPKEYR